MKTNKIKQIKLNYNLFSHEKLEDVFTNHEDLKSLQLPKYFKSEEEAYKFLESSGFEKEYFYQLSFEYEEENLEYDSYSVNLEEWFYDWNFKNKGVKNA